MSFAAASVDAAAAPGETDEGEAKSDTSSEVTTDAETDATTGADVAPTIDGETDSAADTGDTDSPQPGADTPPAPEQLEGSAASADEVAPPVRTDPVSAALLERAAAIEALVANRLGLEVDARALLELDLNAPYARAWLEAVGHTGTDDATALSPAQVRFSAAWQALQALDVGRREALVRTHNEARLAAGYQPQDLASLRARLLTTQAKFEKLRNFLSGTLPTDVDITADLHIDATTPVGLGDLTLEMALAYRPVPGRPLVQELAAVRQALAFLRYHYAGLYPEAKRQLHARHRGTPTDEALAGVNSEDPERSADEAAEAREQALRAAAAANTDELRRIEEARATLLGLQASVSQAEASLERTRKQWASAREAVTALTAAGEKIATMSPLDGDPTPAAGALLTRARDLYKQTCSGFADDLAAAEQATSELPDIAGELAQIDPIVLEDERIAPLRAELSRRAKAVRERERAERWEHLRERQADLAAINEVRQTMLKLAPATQREALNGFSRSGREEARRELTHLQLDLRYWMQALPRRAKNIGTEVLGYPIAVAKGAFTLLVALVVFIAWRRRAPKFFESLANWSKAPPTSLSKRVFGPAFRYAPYVRKSLEWMALAYLLLQVLGHRAQIPGVDMLWQIAVWILGGIAVIRLLHAMASESRYRRRGDPTAELRLNSLRLVGLCATAVGLFLSVTATTVGRGTIFAWMVSTCWILAIPIALLLTTWWRPEIRKRLTEAGHDSEIVRWVLRTDSGLRGFLAAGVGGVYLFISGAKRLLVRRASRFEITRRVLAYLVRREVAKQANRDESPLTGIPAEALARLDPFHQSPPQALVEGPCEQALADLQAQLFDDRVTISAVVGEAGAGKSMVVGILSQKTPNSLVVQCPYSGFDALLERFADKLGLTENEPNAAAIQAALEKYRLIVVDDAHHLVRPQIGGLLQLDRLLEFSRKSPTGTSWVLVLGDPTWQFVLRARAEGAVFDNVVELPRWNEEQIGLLLQLRSKAAGLTPMFDGLEVPRQATDDDNLTEHERREQGYYRILWDYVDGNPAMALHWWQRSLFSDSSSRVVVRLFHPPRFTALDTLPPSVYFTLRALVQLDGAVRSDIVAATQLPAAEIDDSLRFIAARGLTEVRNDRLYLTRDWYRAVTRVLWRRHLVIRRPA